MKGFNKTDPFAVYRFCVDTLSCKTMKTNEVLLVHLSIKKRLTRKSQYSTDHTSNMQINIILGVDSVRYLGIECATPMHVNSVCLICVFVHQFAIPGLLRVMK